MEKRVTDRAKKRVMVRYGKEKADKTAFTKNISPTGIRLQTNGVFKPGTLVLIEVNLGEQEFSMWGRVQWAKKVPPQLAHVLECGMGIFLVEPPPGWAVEVAKWQTA